MNQEINYYIQGFEREKREVNEILKTKDGDFPNDGRIDAEVRDLVDCINLLPFVCTTCSCAGHFSTEESLIQREKDKGRSDFSHLRFPPKGHGFYFDGRLGLAFRPSPQTVDCIPKILGAVAKYPNALIDYYNQVSGLNSDELHKLGMTIRFDNAQIISQRLRPPVFSLAEGFARRNSVKGLIKDLYGVFSDYK